MIRKYRYGQRYSYSWCEGDEVPNIRMVDDFRGYYGHF